MLVLSETVCKFVQTKVDLTIVCVWRVKRSCRTHVEDPIPQNTQQESHRAMHRHSDSPISKNLSKSKKEVKESDDTFWGSSRCQGRATIPRERSPTEDTPLQSALAVLAVKLVHTKNENCGEPADKAIYFSVGSSRRRSLRQSFVFIRHLAHNREQLTCKKHAARIFTKGFLFPFLGA